MVFDLDIWHVDSTSPYRGQVLRSRSLVKAHVTVYEKCFFVGYRIALRRDVFSVVCRVFCAGAVAAVRPRARARASRHGVNGRPVGRSVGFGGLAAVEDPVDEVEDGEDDREALARQLVDAPRVVLAVVRRRRGRRQRRRQRPGHRRLRRLRLLLLGGRVMPVMRRRLEARARRRRDERLVDARYHWDAVRSAADHRRVADRRVRAAVNRRPLRMRLHRHQHRRQQCRYGEITSHIYGHNTIAIL